MMRKRSTKFAGVFLVSTLCGLVVAESAQVVHADPPNVNVDVPMPDQTAADSAQVGECSGQGACGGWASMDGGTDSRPYVKYLSVTNGATETVVFDNVSDAKIITPENGSNIMAAIYATNLCGPGQEPAAGSCYSTPNRVAVTFGYADAGQATADLGYGGASPTVNTDSIIHVKIALNTLGKSLRWSYLQGTPVSWNITNIGLDNAMIDLKFKPASRPWEGGCSQIPVNPTCETTAATSSYVSGSLLLSLDETLDEVFTGALFAGEDIFIGSLEASPPSQTEQGGQAPQMTYGIAAPRKIGDNTNSPTFEAFLSDRAILNYFGATPEVAAANGFFDAAFNVSSTGTSGASPPTITPTRWTADLNGSDGWLISITNISLTTLTTSGLSASSLHTAAKVVRNPKFTVKNKVQAPFISASRTQVSLNGNVTGCTLSSCRIVVKQIKSQTGTKTTNLGIAALVKSGTSLTAYLSFARIGGKELPRFSIVLQRKVNNQWRYLTSAVRRAG